MKLLLVKYSLKALQPQELERERERERDAHGRTLNNLKKEDWLGF